MKRLAITEALRMLAFFVGVALFVFLAVTTYGNFHHLWQYGLLALALMLGVVAGLGDGDPASTPDFLQRWLDYRGKR